MEIQINKNQVKQTVKKIVDDLRDRTGFQEVIDDMQPDDQDKMEDELLELIWEQLQI